MHPKIKNLMTLIKRKAKKGEFIILPHALERKHQRGISVNDIIYVLMNGWHESKKDEYRKDLSTWNYAIKGKTIDKEDMRVIVSFDEDNMLIITVIKLTR